MPKYVFVVFTEPVAGRDAEFNAWYSEAHLADVKALEGVFAAKRYKLAAMDPEQDGHPRYLALYEIETDDVSSIPRAIAQSIADGRMPISGALDRSRTVSAYYEAL